MKRLNYKRNAKILRNIDWTLVMIICIIFVFGLIILSSATHSNITKNYTQLYKQVVAFILGIGLIVLILIFDYNSIGRYYKEMYVVSIILMGIVLIPGVGDEQYGARSWISIGGGFNIQTSEIAKIIFILSYAKIVDIKKDLIYNLKGIFELVLYALPMILLLLAQPDLGTAIVYFFIVFAILFTCGLDRKIIRNSIIAMFVATPLLYLFMDDHQKVRIVNFINPNASSNYQLLQSMIAIGSGGIFGKGLYSGSQNQENFLPVRDSDFIFAVVGEELGLLGMLFVIVLFLLFITRLVYIAKRSKNSYGTFIVSGIIGMFAYQIIQNIAMTVGLMPVTGITLPFISYGGSSLISSMACIGIVLNVYLRRIRLSVYN